MIQNKCQQMFDHTMISVYILQNFAIIRYLFTLIWTWIETKEIIISTR